MFNSVQLFGFVLLGGLAAGALSRRTMALPRTTGYVLFGLLVGQSGLSWITPLQIESAQLFIDLALGLILFELGYLVPVSYTHLRAHETVLDLVCRLLLDKKQKTNKKKKKNNSKRKRKKLLENILHHNYNVE